MLIIGASGFIGSHIYSYAKQCGFAVTGTALSKNNSSLIGFDLAADSIETIISKMSPDSISEVCAVICSAITKIDTVYKDKEHSFNINVTSTIRLINTLVSYGVKIVFISSAAVFDGNKGHYDELDATSPVNEYGRQKVEIERYIISNCNDYLIFRIGIVTGDKLYDQHLFSDWYNQIRQHGRILCIEGQIFSALFVDDAAKGIIASLTKNLTGLYHMANSEFFLRNELARQFTAALELNAEIITKPLEEFNFIERRAQNTSLNGMKFTTDTGFNFTSAKTVIHSFRSNITSQPQIIIERN